MSAEPEKKRALEDSDEASNPHKKHHKPLEELSEDGPLTQQDVVYFKKEAIWRQMSHYKRQAASLAREVGHFKTNFEANEARLAIVDAWYAQMINLLALDGKTSVEADPEGLVLAKLSSLSPLAIDQLLEKRREHLLAVLKPIMANSKLVDIDAEKLLQKYEVLNLQLAQAQSENSVITNTKADLQSRLEALQDELFQLHKERDRLVSRTLKRINDANSTTKEEDEKTDIKKESSADPKDANGSTSPAKESLPEDKEALERLNIELDELKSASTVLQGQLEEVSKKHLVLLEDNSRLKARLSDLSESDLKQSAVFQALSDTNKHLEDEVFQTTKSREQLVERLKAIEQQQAVDKNLLEKTVIEENESLRAQLAKSESDLVRIRTARDELLSKQTILKLELASKQSSEEVNAMNKVLSDRIKQMLEKSAVDDSKYDSLSHEELLKRVQVLTSELTEVELAFQETRTLAIKKLDKTVDLEGMVKKLTIEKTKADQKYFASMRLKDALTAENKILKTQVAKSQELNTKLGELEKTYTSKIELLSTSVAEYKTIGESSLQENTRLQELNKALAAKRAGLEKEVARLMSEVARLTKASGDSDTELRQAQVNVSKLESRIKNTDSLLKKYRANNTSSLLQEDEKQLEALRSIAKCSVCSKNWKDTAITVCGHVFCNGCTQERLAARLRRCPSCNKGFSANDLLSIHL